MRRCDVGRRPVIEVRLLGAVEAILDGEPLHLGSPKQQAVLASLALAAGTTVPADRLIQDLWAEAPPSSAATTLRSLVYRLRHALTGPTEAPLRGTSHGYVLDLGPEAIDALHFEGLTRAARQAVDDGRVRLAADRLAEGLALWRGPALGDLGSWPTFAERAHHLDEARRIAVEELAEARLMLGQPAQAVALLEPFVTAHPLREGACAQLMLGLYRAGRQADALDAYHRVRVVLAEELGIDPGPALRDLHDAILRQRPDLAGPALHREPRGNLPVATSSFIGRVEEIEEINGRLASAQVVTLTGPGGAGKTRLALQVAAALADRFPDGIWFVALLDLRDPSLLEHEVATTLGLDPAALESGGRRLIDGMCELLQQRVALIVLDNCEHLIEAAAVMTHTIAARCPEIVVLATSREALAVPGECVTPVGPLSLPPVGAVDRETVVNSDAVRLLCSRAAEHQPGFTPSDSNAGAIARIVHRLDGIPLALELAAARLRLLGPHKLAERLDDRFRLLTAGARTGDPRHRTLAATIEWSYDLLTEPEQVVLRRLAVFPSDFSLEAAEAVAGADGLDVLDLLGHLVDKSLLVPVPLDDTDVRYRLLETIREYAAIKLADAGETASVLVRHRSFFARDHRPWAEFTHGPALRWAALEADNLRVAMVSARSDGDDTALLRLVALQGAYWYLNGSPDALDWGELAIAVSTPADVGDRTFVRVVQTCLLGGDDPRRCARLLADALTIAEQSGDRAAQGWVRAFAAESAIAAGRHVEVETLLAPVLAWLPELGQATLTAWTHCLLAELAAARGELDTACALVDQGLAAFASDTDDYRVAHVRGLAAVLASADGRPEEADMHAAEALRVARSIPGRRHIVMALARAAETAVLSSRVEPARDLLDELLALLRVQGTPWWVAEALELTALVLGTDRPEVAATLLGAAGTVRGGSGEEAGIQPVLAARLAACRHAACAVLGQARYSASTAQGAGLSLTEALAYARIELHRLHLVPDPVVAVRGR